MHDPPCVSKLGLQAAAKLQSAVGVTDLGGFWGSPVVLASNKAVVYGNVDADFDPFSRILCLSRYTTPHASRAVLYLVPVSRLPVSPSPRLPVYPSPRLPVSPSPHTRRVPCSTWCHAYRMLICACNPMTSPIHTSSGSHSAASSR